ncbi:MAG: hypothetical protein V3R73_02900, partial [Sphingomonadales bacterium]
MQTAKPWWTGIFGLIVTSLIFLTFDPPPAKAADVCRAAADEDAYPTQQPLFFQLKATSAGGEEAREIKARLAGSGRPPATLRVFRTVEETLENRLTATVVPLIQTDATTLDMTASLHVPEMAFSNSPAKPEIEALADRLEAALVAWRKTLTVDEKKDIQRYGTVELTLSPGFGPVAGARALGPLTVTFVFPIKKSPDLYDIGKGLERRLAQYKVLNSRYQNLEGNRLEEGLARLDTFDEGLGLFDADLTASFERLADLQEDISGGQEALAPLQTELVALRAENSAAQSMAAPALYVDADNKRTSPEPAAGFLLLEDALRRTTRVNEALYNGLLNQPNDRTTRRLYRESEAKLIWLKATAKTHKEATDKARADKFTELSERMTALRAEIDPKKAELRTMGAERDGLSREGRAYYRKLLARFDRRNRAPRLKTSPREEDDEETLLDAHDWIENTRAFEEGEREKLDRELGALIVQLTSIDAQLAVLTRDVMEHRRNAGCAVIRALKKAKNPDLIGVMGEFNTLADELKSASGTAATRA